MFFVWAYNMGEAVASEKVRVAAAKGGQRVSRGESTPEAKEIYMVITAPPVAQRIARAVLSKWMRDAPVRDSVHRVPHAVARRVPAC